MQGIWQVIKVSRAEQPKEKKEGGEKGVDGRGRVR